MTSPLGISTSFIRLPVSTAGSSATSLNFRQMSLGMSSSVRMSLHSCTVLVANNSSSMGMISLDLASAVM